MMECPRVRSEMPESSVMPNNSKAFDLLVVGAGPIELSAALGAIERGAKNVLIVEQARELTKAGRMVDIVPNALTATQLICPAMYEKVKPFLFISDNKTAKFSSISVTGESLYSISSCERGDAIAMLRWWHLQEILISLLPDKDMLLLNHQLVDLIHENDEVVCAQFVANRQQTNKYKNWEGDDEKKINADGSRSVSSILHTAGLTAQPFEYTTEIPTETRTVKFRAKLIIGADGINSTARRCIYRESGDGWEKYAGAVYSGLVRMGALGNPKIPKEDEQTITDKYVKTHLTCMMTCEKEKVTSQSMRAVIVRPVKREQNGWKWKCVFYVAFDESRLATLSAKDVKDSIHEIAESSGFPEEIVKLSKALWEDNESNTKSIRALYIVPVEHPAPYERLSTANEVDYPTDFARPWYHKRVVLVGDALHASPPFHAQGNGMGMEDVHELMVRLAAGGAWSSESSSLSEQTLGSIFEEYRKARRERICFLHKITINRESEYNWEAVHSNRKFIWNYEPSVKDNPDQRMDVKPLVS